MNINDTQVNQLVLNLIESRANFDTMKSNGLSANELYLVSDDNQFPVTAINYVSTDTPKFNYETEDGSTSSKTFGQNGLTVYDLDQVFGGA